ncbi:MAG: LysR family transcriptional regulator [Steroidobacteraceae bacterium]
MTIDQLRSFVKIVQLRSFTAAAQQLGTDKGHLSRVMTGLERQLGIKLLTRSTRSLSLTEVGREIYERAVGILAAVEETEQVAQRTQGEPSGVLRLTCGAEFGMLTVSDWIAGYCQRYPKVRVEADFTSRLVDVVHEGFDVAIRIGPLQESRLSARSLGHLRYGLFASMAYLQRAGAPSTAADLRQHALLMFATGSHRAGWTLERHGQRTRIEGPALVRVNNVFAVRDAALRGLGIAQLPEMVAASAKRGQLVRLLEDWSIEQVPVHAVFPSSRYLTPKVRAFIDYAVEHFT